MTSYNGAKLEVPMWGNNSYPLTKAAFTKNGDPLFAGKRSAVMPLMLNKIKNINVASPLYFSTAQDYSLSNT